MIKRKVLVIDDERLLMKSTCMALNLFGFEASGSLDGEQGIAAATAVHPDIILLDIMMPGMDGWQVLEKLKAQEATRHIPVVIFTAKEYSSGVTLAETRGAVDYIAKPFDMDEMVKVLEKQFGVRGAPSPEGSDV
jgi:two-component system, NtrC family, response regulator AtoC